MSNIKQADMQTQIDQINQKLDLVLHYVNEQRLKSERMDDLVSDLSIVGTDMWHTTVEELDNRGIDLDIEEVKLLLFRLVRNVGNFNQVMGMFENLADLLKDAGPIAREAGIDLIHKLHALEKKGYFEFFKETGRILDNIVSSYSVEDVRMLADNIVTILDTVKNLTQPEMLQAMNNAINIYKNLDPSDIQEYSLWKAFREMNTPEMKKGIGFMMAFLKSLAKQADQENKQTVN